jgi:acyl transferase domain-containing protein/NADPH:quinone reductase-like Zn-dependent oxidoreductase/acyl carrier protein
MTVRRTEPQEPAALSPLKRAFIALEEAQSRLAATQAAAREPIAIIGMGCRVPGGADTPDAFWRLLRDGVDAIDVVPADRWDIDALYDPNPDVPGRIGTRYGGFVRDIDRFDPVFFGIAPREAQGMDPQQRVLLEVAWEALEHAGQAPDRLERSITGVYVGVTGSDYTYLQVKAQDDTLLDSHFASGIAHSVVSGRVSYLLGLQGPSLTIDTACSSSLVAVHLACQALRAGECQMALAGGVNAILSPDLYIAFTHSRMLAPDGRCKTFDAAADGFARAEGCGVIVLKRLSDARAAGDRILAVIRGSAVNQDGPSSGLTAPNGPAQEALMREALTRAGLRPADVSYIEAHGTGTQLGDPLEVHALGAVFGDRDPKRPLSIGSVKTNLGHLESAAGIAGIIKTVLALQHRTIPAHLHFNTPSPHIQWADYPLRVPTSAEAWEPIGGRRIAGVSAFGFSGTNAHVVLEEAPEPPPATSAPDRPVYPLVISARDEHALASLASRYAAALDGYSQSDVASFCHTANVGRARFAHRATVVAGTPADLRAGLNAVAEGRTAANVRTAFVARRDPPRIAFLFTGQGAQYAGMARGLYEQAPVFRAALDRCADLLQPHLTRPLLDVMFPVGQGDTSLNETQYTQPALFAVEYALAELWRSCGVIPNVVLGHSVGEYVAACVAGVMNLEDSLRLIARRGALMQSLPSGGGMAAIFAPEAQVVDAMRPHGAALSIAAVNGPAQTVVSGSTAAIEAVCQALTAQGVRCQTLTVSHAFHSPLVEPILDAFEREFATVRLAAPRLTLISNVSGAAARADEIAQPRYWRRHVRDAVRFGDGLISLNAQRPDCIVEIGPHPTLLSFATAVFGDGGPLQIASLHKQRGDWEQWLDAMTRLYLAGVDVDWRALEHEHEQRIVDVPTYPFQRQRCWFPVKRARATTGGRRTGHPLLGAKLRTATADAIYESRVAADEPAFVQQHRVLGHVILPATAFLDTLHAAARATYGRDAVHVEDVVVQEAMVFEQDGAPRAMQVVCGPPIDGVSSATISSTADTDDASEPWITHVRASLRVTDTPVTTGVSLEDARARCADAVSPLDFYGGFERRGLDFGSGFRAIRSLWRGDGQALGQIELTADLAAEASTYGIHPVLLDGCVQVLAAAIPDDDDALYLPIGIESFALQANPGASAWSHVSVSGAPGGESLSGEIHLFDANGASVGRLGGLRLKRVRGDALAQLGDRWLDRCLYDVRWPAVDTGSNGRATWSLSDLTGAGSAAVHQLSTVAGIAAYDPFLRRFDALCATYVAQALRRLGWNAVEGELVQTSSLAQRLGVATKYTRLFGRLLGILAETGIVAPVEGGWRVLKALPTDDPEPELARLRAQCPTGADAELEMTGRVASEFAEALRGERDPMQLLFPGGSTANAESLYRDSPTAKFYNGLVTEVMSAIAATRPNSRSLRILEVGGGTGGTTAHVAPRLPADGISYTFTDLGSTFVARARSRFGSYPFMRFETLDLERELDAQGFQGQQFDIVIASNVIHATSDLRRTLGRVRRLLAPGGLLVMLEVTAPQRWFDLTVGVTDGWWAFSDADLRVDYPTLSRERWLQLLGECGFEASTALPEGTGHTGCLALQSLLLARASQTAPASASRAWLVFGDRRGIGAGLADRLRAAGDRCTVVRAGTAFSASAGEYTIDPANAADYRRVLADVNVAGRPIDGVVHAWSLDADEWEHMSLARLKAAETQGPASAMYLAQALVAERPAPRLWVLTGGVHQIDAQDRTLSPAQAGAWGVAKALAIEHPELRAVCIDLEPGAEIAGLDAVIQELNEPGDEAHVAVRRGSRHVGRLTRLVRPKTVEGRDRPPVRLVPETPGSIERFRLDPIARRAPGVGEVEIAVDATGLNFKDVLNALGMYPGDPGPLGGECAGRIVAVGAGVSHIRPGDEVLAVAGDSFASHVIARAAFVQPRPPGMSAEEGAAFPIPYLTAEFCLGHLARIRQGERVLIHAAAGGVGMAAVRLAQRTGAEVYATAGSPRKRELLRSMGVAHVLDSRTTAFADAILMETGGAGVDIVLNSLSGDQIEASFKALARGGRFVEIGKRGIKDEQWVAAQGRGHRYFVVDWGETAAQDPALIAGMLERLVGELRDGTIPPLPRHVFALDDASRAFRFMAQARHTGKIVVRHSTAPVTPAIRRDGTYLITGGLSGLGLAIAQWLTERGAGRLVLVSRRGVTPESAPVLDDMRARGTAIVAEALDVSDEGALTTLLARVRSAGPPLRGVVHSAGTLADAGLMQQDASRFAKVFAPKAHGAYLLDALTRIDPLDLFVLFSSAASVLGSGGQSNHSAANAVLDTLARERQARGLAGLSINWGPWKDVGAAADRGITARLASEGLDALGTSEGLAAFGRALNGSDPQVAVLSIDWNRYRQRARHVSSPFFADVAGRTTMPKGAHALTTARQEDLRQRVIDAPEARKRGIVQAFVAEKALRALGLDPARAVDPRTPLGELGLDSLLAVELRNMLGSALGKPLPATLLFDYPTIATLTDYLMTEVLELEAAPAFEERPAAAASLVGSIEELSDEEVERLLAARAKRPERT